MLVDFRGLALNQYKGTATVQVRELYREHNGLQTDSLEKKCVDTVSGYVHGWLSTGWYC